jgi:hypothetical protein
MFPPHKPYIPNGISEIRDYLGMMNAQFANVRRQDG